MGGFNQVSYQQSQKLWCVAVENILSHLKQCMCDVMLGNSASPLSLKGKQTPKAHSASTLSHSIFCQYIVIALLLIVVELTVTCSSALDIFLSTE